MLAVLQARPPTRAISFARICTTRHFASNADRELNRDLIQTLTRYMDDEKASDSKTKQYKVRAYATAIDAIRRMDEPVRSGDQLLHVKGVGLRIARRIDAFIAGVPYKLPCDPPTRKSRPKVAKPAHQRQILQALGSIRSIGNRTATNLYEAGCTSSAELSEPKFFQLLSPVQQLAVRYRNDFDQPVTLEEAEAVRSFISQNISQKYDVMVAGDHRRVAADSTYISLLILQPTDDDVFLYPPPPPTKRVMRKIPPHSTFMRGLTKLGMLPRNVRTVEDSPLFRDIISPLESRALIAETIFGGLQKWVGIVRIPGVTEGPEKWEDRARRRNGIESVEGRFCRVEISFAPTRCAGAALIALTGDQDFNNNIRDQAVRSGLCLNEYGLWRWHGDSASADVDSDSDPESPPLKDSSGHWEFLFGDSEEKIFKEISMPYVDPKRRNFSYLAEGRKKSSASRSGR